MERITITIDANLLALIDATVDNEEAKNRSHAIELLLRQALAKKPLTTAVILASGSRETLFLPGNREIKPLIEINGKKFIEHVVEKLKNAGVTRLVIVVGVDGQKIVNALKLYEKDIHIEYIFEEKGAGSAASLLLAKSHIKEPFFLSYSDVYYPDLDLADLLHHHRQNSKDNICTMALVNVKTPNVFGVAKLTGYKIVSFAEKPKASAGSNLVNGGIAVCEPSIFFYLPKSGSFEKEIFPVLAQRSKLFAYVYSGKWQDAEWDTN